MPSTDTGRDLSFEDFFRRELSVLVAVARALTGRQVLAEELAQEAMLVVHRRWDHVRTYSSPAGFARRVVINKSVSSFRRTLAEGRALARIARPSEAAPALSERDDEIWRAVRALPSRQAQAVALRYVVDLDTAAIAETLGCAEATVRVLLHRARVSRSSALGRQDLEEVPDEPRR